MKNSKFRIIAILTGLLLFNSCIIKSLFPFYTKDTISFQQDFIGIWQTSSDKKNRWIIASVEDIHNLEKEKGASKISKEDIKFYEEYKHAYYAVYEEKTENRTSVFLAVPFKVKDELFLDFTPFTFDERGNELVSYHLAPTHSLAKFDIINNDQINIRWLASKKLIELIESKKIKIKHEKLSPSKEYLLTASPQELQKFIAKYMNSNDADKWETDVYLDLKRTHSKKESLDLIKRVIKGEEKLSGDLSF